MPELRELLRHPTGPAQEHRLNILRAIMFRSSNQRDLARRCGLSEATVSTAVTELEKRGIVRKGPPVTLAPITGVAVGIEVDFEKMTAVARRVDQSFEQVAVRSEPVGGADGLTQWLDAASKLIHSVAHEVGDGPNDIATVGLAIPRPVDPRSQRLTLPLLSPWENVSDPGRLLTSRLHDLAPAGGSSLAEQLHVRVDNDAILGALAESTYAHSSKETLIYIKASTGIGAGIVIGGRVFRGRRGVAGEIGHVVVEHEGHFCQCGGRGCLETVVGGRRLVDQARTALDDRSITSLDDIIRRARVGNPVCQRVLREAAHRLGGTIGNLCNILNPDVVVLGGSLGSGSDLIMQACRAGVNQTAMAAARESNFFELVPASLLHATAHGALLLGLQGTTYEF